MSEDHADGNVECRGIDASEEAAGDDINVMCLSVPHALPAVAQAPIHSPVASQGTGVVRAHNVDMAMH
jgi:hypothetical protein